MARKNKEPRQEVLEDPPTSINPYNVLEIDKTANAEQVKSAYRKAALRHHPDKASSERKEEAHARFQEIAFAYAILSDERRRKRYDTTGNTSESLNLEDDDFDWIDFFREQTAAMVDGAMIDKIKKEYQGSEEEKRDVLAAYEEHEGDMDVVYEVVMCSDVLQDDERFRTIIDHAIAAGDVSSYPAYTTETKTTKKRRRDRAQKEAEQALELAEELGVKDKLFGNGAVKKGQKGKDEDALRALIQQRQKGRAETFLDRLESKYGNGQNGKKREQEPSEEAFQRNAKKKKTTK